MNGLLETLFSVGATMTAGGWTLLRMMTAHLEQRQHDLVALIDTRFESAEEHRAMATRHWQQLFQELQRRQEANSQRIGLLENRLTTHQIDGHKQRHET